MTAPRVSILVPAYNEVESLGPLHDHVTRVMQALARPYEIVVVDDGSTDGTAEELERLVAGDDHLRVISLRRNCGKSAALTVGFREVVGEYVITLDGDLQDDPDEIPGLLEKLEEGYDLISGWKRRRHDPISKRFPSRVFNFVTARVSGLRLHDFNCGIKAYRREVVRSLRIYGDLYRFIPVLADRLGFRVGEKEVRHHPRRFGRSKYWAARFINGFLDLLTVMFLGRSRRSPLHVFGRIGGFLLIVGLAVCVYMLGIWLVESALRVRPLLIGGVILVILGIQFISMGLLAEMVASTHREDEDYAIRRRLP